MTIENMNYTASSVLDKSKTSRLRAQLERQRPQLEETKAVKLPTTTNKRLRRDVLNDMLDELEQQDPAYELLFTTKWGGCIEVSRILKDG